MCPARGHWWRRRVRPRNRAKFPTARRRGGSIAAPEGLRRDYQSEPAAFPGCPSPCRRATLTGRHGLNEKTLLTSTRKSNYTSNGANYYSGGATLGHTSVSPSATPTLTRPRRPRPRLPNSPALPVGSRRIPVGMHPGASVPATVKDLF